MKKVIFVLVAALVAACSGESPCGEPQGTVAVKFSVEGDFTVSTYGFTRALEADGKAMTDVWVFDYAGGGLLQQVHQVSTDEDFGQPTMRLSLGEHKLYFVASRGGSPVVDTSEKTITWGTVRDTFWKELMLTVSAKSGGGQAVILDRVVTKLKLSITDEVPVGCSSVTVEPSEWYSGIDYTTGATSALKESGQTITVPSSYAGTTDLIVSIFGFSDCEEWSTDVTVVAKDGDGETVGRTDIEDVPLMRNRVTEYSGPLFGGCGAMVMSLNGEWEETLTGGW